MLQNYIQRLQLISLHVVVNFYDPARYHVFEVISCININYTTTTITMKITNVFYQLYSSLPRNTPLVIFSSALVCMFVYVCEASVLLPPHHDPHKVLISPITYLHVPLMALTSPTTTTHTYTHTWQGYWWWWCLLGPEGMHNVFNLVSVHGDG